jgi:hypothetical protein
VLAVPNAVAKDISPAVAKPPVATPAAPVRSTAVPPVNNVATPTVLAVAEAAKATNPAVANPPTAIPVTLAVNKCEVFLEESREVLPVVIPNPLVLLKFDDKVIG